LKHKTECIYSYFIADITQHYHRRISAIYTQYEKIFVFTHTVLSYINPTEQIKSQ